MKKHLALVLALVMVLSSFSFVSAAPDFADVDGTMYEEAVDRLELLNILKGYPDGTFRPEDTITRAEFATVAVRTLGLAGAAESAVGLPSGFSDVPAHHWAARFVGTAASAGIVNGIGNGLFAPEAPVKYEEAVTMLVRALGYGPEAQSRGGYPYGYLIVAEQIDLLDGVRAVQGTFASRGTVALLTDNALELPMMVSIGFGDNIRWVVSGTERTEEVTLLDEMGFDAVEGRLSEYDDDDMEIYINDEEENDSEGWYEVAEGFDFYEYHGASVKAWVDGDEVLVIKATEDLMFDAVEVTKTEEEIKLIDANKKYDVDADAYVWINGEEADVEDLVDNDMHNYAKIGLNSENDVMFYDGYTWDGYVVFEELDTDDDFIYGYEWELDIEDFTFVKDGKTIAADEIEEGDIVFYNEAADFAEVFNVAVEGEFDEIFNTTFEVDGEEFEYTLDNFADIEVVYHVNEDDEMAMFDDEVAEQMEEEGEVAVYVDRFGNAVFVTGDLGPVSKSTIGALLYKDMAGYTDIRERARLELSVVTEMGEEVTYDFRLSDLEKLGVDGFLVWEDDDADLTLNPSDVGNATEIVIDGEDNIEFADYKKGQVIEITVDVDGDVIGVQFFTSSINESIDDDVVSGDTYVANRRMGSDVPVFFIAEGVANWDDEDVEVIMYGDLEEDVEIKEYNLYHDGAKGLYMVVTDSDMEAVITEQAVVTQVRENTDGDITRIRAFVGNSENTYYTEDPLDMTLLAGTPVELKIIESSERVQSINILDETTPPSKAEVAVFDVDANFVATSVNRKVNDYTLVSGGYIFDISDTTDIGTMTFAELNDVEVGTKITVVFDNVGNDTYIKYVLVGETPEAGDPVEVTGVVTYINTARTSFEVDGETIYTITASTILRDADGNTLALGLEAGDVLNVTDIVDVDGDVIVIVESPVTEAEEAAAAALEAAVTAAEAAQTAYTEAGGDVALAVYTDVTAAITSEVTADIVTTTEALVAATTVLEEAAADAAAVDAVEVAATEGNKVDFLAALAYEGFTGYDAANDDAYFADRANFKVLADVAAVDAAIDAVNVEEAAAAALEAAVTAAEAAQTAYTEAGGDVALAVYTDVTAAITSEVTADIVTTTEALVAATTVLEEAAADAAAVDAVEAAATAEIKADFLAALAYEGFTGYDAANDDAYFAAVDTFKTLADVAAVDAAIDAVNVAL